MSGNTVSIPASQGDASNLRVKGASPWGITLAMICGVLVVQALLFTTSVRGVWHLDVPRFVILVDVLFFGYLIYTAGVRQIPAREIRLDADRLTLVNGNVRTVIPVSEVREIRHGAGDREAGVTFGNRRFVRAAAGPNLDAFLTELSAQSGVPIRRIGVWDVGHVWRGSPRQS